MRFVDDETTGSTLRLSPEVSARVSCAKPRVLRLASAGTGADDDANAVTLGFADLCVNAAANAWSRDVVGFLDFSVFPCSSSSSSSTSSVSFACLIIGFFFFGPQPGVAVPSQLFTNALYATCMRSLDPGIVLCSRLCLGGSLALARAEQLLDRHIVRLVRAAREGRYEVVHYQLSGLFPPILGFAQTGPREPLWW